MIRNVHERVVAAPLDEVGALLDAMAERGNPLWPAPDWPALRLDAPLGVGARGGHGPVRYEVTAYRPGREVEFTFHPNLAVQGTHTLTLEATGTGATRLRHVLAGRPQGIGWVLWPLAVRWLHDALVEDLLDRAAYAVGTPPARAATWSPWVRTLRRLVSRRAGGRTVPAAPSVVR